MNLHIIKSNLIELKRDCISIGGSLQNACEVEEINAERIFDIIDEIDDLCHRAHEIANSRDFIALADKQERNDYRDQLSRKSAR